MDLPKQGARQIEDVSPAHTFVLVGIIVAVAAIGACLDRHAETVGARSAHEDPTREALLFIAVQAAMLAYVGRVGFVRHGLLLWLGERWPRLTAVDLGLAALAFAAILGVESAVTVDPAAAPHRPLAIALAVAVSAGVGEEIVYRGYLQRRLGVLTRSPSTGVVLQAVLFGIAHGDRGGAFALRCALYGFILGSVAWARRSVLPGMICHVAIDLWALG